MDVSIQSLVYFVIITIIYFAYPSIGKPQLTINDLKYPESLAEYNSTTIQRMGIYLALVLLIQLILNSYYLMDKCGGLIGSNIGVAALFTFFPWLLILGVLMIILYYCPGWKSAFANVIGYFVVANSANQLFGDILISSDVNNIINNASSEEEKRRFSDAAESLMKLCGNKSILINAMTSSNFLELWSVLKIIMKPQYKDNVEVQQQMLDLVTLKENIGEALWYTYTAIFISSIVYYNLATRGCVKTAEQLKADAAQAEQQQEEAAAQQELNNSVTYTTS